jgi:hypothetical protein
MKNIKLDYSKLLALGLPVVISMMKKTWHGSKSKKPMMTRSFHNENGQKIDIFIDDDSRDWLGRMKITIEGPRGSSSWTLTNIEASELAGAIFKRLGEGP